jgi:hypothetical protein
MLMLCAAAAGVTYVLYDRATRIDRSTPVVVVEQYVNVLLSDRDDERASLFECDGKRGARTRVKELRTQLEDLERRFDIDVIVSTANYDWSIYGARSDVQVDLLIDVPEADGRPSRSKQRWGFELRDEDGWRVCDARRVS